MRAKHPGAVCGGVDREAAPAKVLHRRDVGAAEEPEQRTVGVDAERRPVDAVGQPRHQRPAETDRRAAAQPFDVPADAVADGDVDSFVLEVALLVGDIGDEFFVDPVPDVGQVDGVHGACPFSDPLVAVTSVHRQAAVDRQVVAGGETGILAGQERDGGGDLVGTDEAAHRVGRPRSTRTGRPTAAR